MSDKARQVKVTSAAAEPAGRNNEPASEGEAVSANGTDARESAGTPQLVEMNEPQANGDGTAQAARAKESDQPADVPPADATPADVTKDESLGEERDRLRKEIEEQLDRFQRAQAEFENIRKRLRRGKEDAYEYASMDVIESLLPIVDDFQRALESPGLDSKFREGLELISKRIFDVFSRAGLKPIEAGDGKFNPHLHHAVDKAPAENDEQDQQILEVYQPGYLFKDRLLRASIVKVAVKD
jgi:molecular chaperone GrpE